MGNTSGEGTDFPAGALGVTPSGVRIFRFLVFRFLSSPVLSGAGVTWSLVICVVYCVPRF
jgi:hypothetical protein